MLLFGVSKFTATENNSSRTQFQHNWSEVSEIGFSSLSSRPEFPPPSLSKQMRSIFQQNIRNWKIQQLKIVPVTAPWHWGKSTLEGKNKIFSSGWLPVKHFQLFKSMKPQNQMNYSWISVCDTWYWTIPIGTHGTSAFQRQNWGKPFHPSVVPLSNRA